MQFSLGNRIPAVWKRVTISGCHLFTLWLLYCVCLSFPLVLGLDVDRILSVPEFSYIPYLVSEIFGGLSDPWAKRVLWKCTI